MSYLFLIVKERENEKKEIVTEQQYVEGLDIADVMQHAIEMNAGFDDEIIKVERLVPICGHVERRIP